MANSSIEVRGMTEIIQRMQAFPGKLSAQLKLGMSASLTALWEKVPPYPPPPQDSTYRRTGTLGRTLGSSESGGSAGGKPDIFETKQLGAGLEGTFGTNLDYAPHAIGDSTQAAHMSHWWKMSKIAKDAQGKILSVWKGIAANMANFLEGRGLL